MAFHNSSCSITVFFLVRFDSVWIEFLLFELFENFKFKRDLNSNYILTIFFIYILGKIYFTKFKKFILLKIILKIYCRENLRNKGKFEHFFF